MTAPATPPAGRQRRIRSLFDSISAEYQAIHDPYLSSRELAWGTWLVPEARIGALGDVAGKRVLDLGCGGGQWVGALAKAGADAIGVDLSLEQLRYAASRTNGGTGLVHADGESLPFADESFDIVISDHGALSWAPRSGFPEAARVVRRGGLILANGGSPWVAACWDDTTHELSTELRQDYFSDTAVQRPVSVLLGVSSEEVVAAKTTTYGDWIRLFRSCGLIIEDLIELRPHSEETPTSYVSFVDDRWARRWPAECLWVTRRP